MISYYHESLCNQTLEGSVGGFVKRFFRPAAPPDRSVRAVIEKSLVMFLVQGLLLKSRKKYIKFYGNKTLRMVYRF